MMLRTTISRIRKVCSVAFVPRVLRDELCSAPASYAFIREAHKGTKSTDDGTSTEQASDFTGLPLTHRERCQRIIDQAFGTGETEPGRVMSEQYFSNKINIEDTKREIAQAEIERMKLEDLKIENPITPDNRQYGIFKMSRELIKDDDEEEKIMVKENTSAKVNPDELIAEKEAAIAAAAKAATAAAEAATAASQAATATISKKEAAVIAAADAATAVSEAAAAAIIKKEAAIAAATKAATAAAEVATAEIIEKKEAVAVAAEVATAAITEKKAAVVEAARAATAAFAEKNVESQALANSELSKSFNMTSSATKPHLKVEDSKETAEDTLTMDESELANAKDLNISNPETVDAMNDSKAAHLDEETKAETEIVKDDSNADAKLKENDPDYHGFHNATTANENEEKLAQKLEIIEETPLVEAQKPSIDGFNSKPRILGDQHNPVVNYSNIENKQVDLPGTIEEVAKRCLNGPLGQIDDMLLKEMEKLGVPLNCKTEKKAPSPLMGDDLVQMKVSEQVQNEEILSKNAEFEDQEENAGESLRITGSGSNCQLIHDVRLPDLNEQAEEIASVLAEREKVIAINPRSHTLKGNTETKEFKKLRRARRSSQYAKLKASRVAEPNQLTLEQKEPEKRRSFYSRYLESPWGRNAESPNSKARNKNQTITTEEVECQERTSQSATAKKSQILQNETRFAANTQKAVEDVQRNLNLQSEKVTLPEELMREHELDPYYVLTCNETCPISPGPSMSCRNTDFVDTTETIYMKQNICESLLPKPRDKLAADARAQLEKIRNMNGPLRPKIDTAKQEMQSAGAQENLDEIRDLNRTMKQPTQAETDVAKLTTHDQNLAADAQAQLDEIKIITQNTQPTVNATKMYTQYGDVSTDTQKHLNEINRQIIKPVQPKATNVTAHSQAQSDAVAKPSEKERVPHFSNVTPAVVSSETANPVSDRITLTELLRRVRERSRMRYASELGVKVDPTVGKCKKTKCPPMAPMSPPLNPVPPPTFGLPMLKRRPPVCKPPKNKGSKKCTACDLDVGCGVYLGEFCPKTCEVDEDVEVCDVCSRVDLADVVIDRIETLGTILGGVIRQVKSNVDILLARDYEPWCPIPSWPIPKRVEKQKWTPGIRGAPPCVQGCPVFPKARASMNPEPPCNLKPCEGFPKRRSFSSLDYYAVSLGDNKVYDLGQF